MDVCGIQPQKPLLAGCGSRESFMRVISTSNPTWEHDCEEAAKSGQPFRVQDTGSSHLPFFIKLSEQYAIVPRWDDKEVEFHPEPK